MSCWRFVSPSSHSKNFLKIHKWKLASNHIVEIQSQHGALYSTSVFNENTGKNNAQNCSEFCLLSQKIILALENSKQSVPLATSSSPLFRFCHFLLPRLVMRKGCCSNSSVSEVYFHWAELSGSWHCWEMDFMRISGLYFSRGFCLLLSPPSSSMSPVQQEMSERFYSVVWKVVCSSGWDLWQIWFWERNVSQLLYLLWMLFLKGGVSGVSFSGFSSYIL